MKNNTSQKILDYISKASDTSGTAPHELVDFLDIGERAVFKQLKKLYEEGKIDKIGRPPKVFYFIEKKEKPQQSFKISPKVEKIIEKNYLIITPRGERKEGMEGFVYWCGKNNLPVEKTALEYERTFKKYAKYKRAGFIDGTGKLKNTFGKVFLNKLFYLDFYSIERFGKTKLGSLLLYAKQSQNKTLIKELIEIFKGKIEGFIKKYAIKAVAFVPPTVDRKVQLMRELEKNLKLALPKISIGKIKTELIVPQKTLNKLEDRIENARKTFFVDEARKFGNVVLIDDAVGSGSTMNEIGAKIKEKGVCQRKLYGLSITGSFKGFEVISEV